eukprot:scaffold607_cov160-Ochromonas_danica.AAC.1
MSITFRLGRYLHEFILSILEYVMLRLLFPGSPIFSVIENLYLWTFDSKIRQQRKSEGSDTQQNKAEDAERLDWENPQVIGRNRLPMHVQSKSFFRRSDALLFWKARGDSMLVDEAQVPDIARSVYMLTGRAGCPQESHGWEFILVGDPGHCPEGWQTYSDNTTSDEGKSWKKIALPNHWQLQGYDVPLYTNTAYPFRFDPPFAQRDGTWVVPACDLGLGGDPTTSAPLHPNEPGPNATGLYRRKFHIPSEWNNGLEDRVFLVFEGADACLSVWIDGQFVGYSQDFALSCEFDITDVLSSLSNSTEHVLSVRVSRWCDGSYLEDQDKWWLSGLYREVYLQRRPKVFIADFDFKTNIDFSSSDLATEVSVDVLVANAGILLNASSAPPAARLELWDSLSDGEPVLTCVESLSPGEQLPDRQRADRLVNPDTADIDLKAWPSPACANLKGILRSPRLWSAEDPHLFYLVLTVYSSLAEALEGGEGLHTESHRVGVRCVEIGGPDHVLMVNKKPVLIAGVNRLEFDSHTGRAVSKERMYKDALLLKQLNMNAVRSAHYPQHPFWLELLDELGIFFIDEANIETHGFQSLGHPIGYLAHLQEWQSALLSRVTRMLERDKHHACVIGWSLGNESGFGPTHEKMSAWIKERDGSRFVQASDITFMISGFC